MPMDTRWLRANHEHCDRGAGKGVQEKVDEQMRRQPAPDRAVDEPACRDRKGSEEQPVGGEGGVLSAPKRDAANDDGEREQREERAQHQRQRRRTKQMQAEAGLDTGLDPLKRAQPRTHLRKRSGPPGRLV
jgi:hypothetical protein